MPLDQLLAALERAARSTAERLVADARAEAERLTTAADENIARRRAGTIEARTRTQRAALEQVLSDARLSARREILDARESLLARLFDAAIAALPKAIDLPSYRDALSRRVSAALECIEATDRAVIRASQSLAEPLQALIAGHDNVSIEPNENVGSGFRLATVDGVIEVDDTLESRLRIERPQLAREALRRLGLAP
jgi:vacuolar-type H+-ATPase subunit E/Vma4